MYYYSYEEFVVDTKKLIVCVDDFKPEVIVGIARGGLTLSHSIAEGMDIREVQTLRTELYDKSCKRDELSIFDTCDFSDKTRVLVVDDISDSGDTLNAIMNHLKSKFQSIEFKSATLFYKKTSCYEPDYWINDATQWIEFFWEKDFS